MTRRRWGLAALGIVLLAWIIGGEWVSIHQHVPENHFIDALGGLSFLVAGLERSRARDCGPARPSHLAFPGWTSHPGSSGISVFE